MHSSRVPPTFRTAAIVAFIISLAALKLWLTADIGLTLHVTKVDDDLFIRHAWSILHGRWLGPFDALTLSKGPGYPLFIAAAHMLGLRLLVAQQALYIIASIAAAYAFGTVFRNRVFGCALYALLIFNPMSIDQNIMQRPIRDGFYAILIVLLAAGNMLIWNARHRSIQRMFAISTTYGLVLGIAFVTREESAFLAPLAIVPLVAIVAGAIERRGSTLLRTGTQLLAYAVALAVPISIALVNFQYYAYFGIIDMNVGAYARAMSAITSVRQTPYRPDVPLDRDAREKLYRVSPTFARLRPHLEGDEGRRATRTSCRLFHDICDDIGGGWFGWALFYSAVDIGIYRNEASAMTFYTALANEVRAACRDHRLDCDVDRFMGVDVREIFRPALAYDALSAIVATLEFRRFGVGPEITYPDRWGAYRMARESTNEIIETSTFRSYEMFGEYRSKTRPTIEIFDRSGRRARAIDTAEERDTFDIFTPCVDRCVAVFSSGRERKTFAIRNIFDDASPPKPQILRAPSFAVTILQSEGVVRSDPFTIDRKRATLKLIADAYRAVFPYLFVVSIGCIVVVGADAIRRRKLPPESSPLVALYAFSFLRVALIAIVNEKYNDAFETRYLAPLYPCATLALAYHFAFVSRVLRRDDPSNGRARS